MSLTKFKNPSLKDKQEAQDEVADPRFDEMVSSLNEKPVKKTKKSKK